MATKKKPQGKPTLEQIELAQWVIQNASYNDDGAVVLRQKAMDIIQRAMA